MLRLMTEASAHWQAVYLHTGVVELAVAAFTTDADLTLDPVLFDNSAILAHCSTRRDKLDRHAALRRRETRPL